MSVIAQPGTAKRSGRTRTARKSKGVAVALFFIVTLLIPIEWSIGPLHLPPYRMVLLVLTLPCIALLFSGTKGRVRTVDVLLLLHGLWVCLALMAVHGVSKGVEAGGIYFVQAYGSYAIARCFIRTPEDFRRVFRFLLIVVAMTIPFALYESVTGKHLILDTLRQFVPVFTPALKDQRMGLYRAVVVFEHQILYGVFCASILGIVFFIARGGKRLTRAAIPIAATFFSLSSGPIVAVFCQVAIIAWHYLTRRIAMRWWLLSGVVAFMYIAVDILSNRTPVQVFISYLTLNPRSAWNRIHIWNFGTEEIARHPIFGIGQNEWINAPWMSQSMDNFWLFVAVRYGLPGFILLVLAFAALFIPLMRLKPVDRLIGDYRLGWIISMIGLIIAGGTVHYWKNIFCLMMLIFGSAVWMLDYRPERRPEEKNPATPHAVDTGGSMTPGRRRRRP
ncbi:O-antigen ligase family protein [Ferruginivarius sediminum]|uniref:O-antigen ligase domain-containing protein n=1 Tax=Ferruginivarius sediminum TaxID=2661937 RepID=A0A369TBQ8_9PROT|nr:O-antigen ligase family protein [Ferruginivarius sediminum]RDD62282.1 O-antigen ligase domain-containing protein [Ferruginivarius sediminum]